VKPLERYVTVVDGKKMKVTGDRIYGIKAIVIGVTFIGIGMYLFFNPMIAF
jgi:hypothetical protein